MHREKANPDMGAGRAVGQPDSSILLGAGMPQTIRTVLGDRDAGELGTVLHHEHLVFGPENGSDWSGDFDRKQVIEDAVADLIDCHQRHDLSVLVDLTAIGVSRDISLIHEISERSRVAIVVATGFWEGTSYPKWAVTATADELADRFKDELLKGIDGTAYRAGVIKVATATGAITATEATGLRGAARAQRETGAPILTHTGLGSMALEQVAILEQEGVDLERVVIGHLDSTPDRLAVRAVLERGAYVAFDRIGRGRPSQPDDDEKAEALVELIRDGFADRIVLAHDASKWFTHMRSKPDRPPWSYLFDSFLPRLRQLGVSETELKQITVKNPRRVLGW